MLTINAETRDLKLDNGKLREEGKIPAVFYGAKEKSTPITISEVEFMNTFNEAGESTIISLKTDDDAHDALIHDVQFDAVSGKPVHVDFYVIEKGKKLQVSIPLEFVGESPAVKDLGGVLVKVLHELEIEALPKALPSEIEVDISSLNDFEAQVLVKDLKLPEGVETTEDQEEVVALVQEPKEEEEPEEVEPDLESIEVEEKGKKEEGEDSSPDEEKKEE